MTDVRLIWTSRRLYMYTADLVNRAVDSLHVPLQWDMQA
jgi:hypothetical protein